MSSHAVSHKYFVGWDVGGWNCDKNPNSRDAIVILDEHQNVVGKAWRGNLRNSINSASTSREFLTRLFSLCCTELPVASVHVTLGIDTPLGFSQAFADLITKLQSVDQIGQSDTNQYLFRQTELFLFDRGLRPLSAIKDMIGSQATKGMHVLARFAPLIAKCGVWTDGDVLKAIEAYPSACKKSNLIQDSLNKLLVTECTDPPFQEWAGGIDHPDKRDALICALVAHTFSSDPSLLVSPPDSIPEAEGWIWVLEDGLLPDEGIVKIIDY